MTQTGANSTAALDKCSCRIILFFQLLGSNFSVYWTAQRRLNNEFYPSTVFLRGTIAAGGSGDSLHIGDGTPAQKTCGASGQQRNRPGCGQAVTRPAAPAKRLSASGDALSRRGGGPSLLGLPAGALRTARPGSHGVVRRLQEHAGDRHRSVAAGPCKISAPAAGGGRFRGPVRSGRICRKRLPGLPAHLGPAGVQPVHR